MIQTPENFKFFLYRSGIAINHTKQILLSGGLQVSLSAVTNSTQMYNYEEQTLRERSNLKIARYTHSQTMLNSKVYAIGGRGITGVLNSCQRYAIHQNIWQSIAPMQISRCTVPVIPYMNRYLYVLGGYQGKGRLSSIERYDEFKEQWYLLSIKLPIPMEAHSSTFISKSQILLCGGFDGVKGGGQLISFDIQSQDFQKFEPLNIEVHLHGAFKRGQFLYIFGGEKTSEACWKMSLKTLEVGPIKNYSEFVFSSIETFAKVCV